MSAFVSARPIRSMTGYAHARAYGDHCGLGLRFHLAPEIEPHGNLLRITLEDSLATPIGESEPGGIEHTNDQLIGGGGIYRHLHDLEFLEADAIPKR